MTGRLPVAGLLATIGVATTGLRVAGIAIPWFVLTATGSVAQTGLVVAAEFGPYVLSKAIGGPLVDRLGQRRVSIATDLGSAALFGLVPLLHLLGALPLPALLLIVAAAGALRGPGDAAKHTLAPLVAAAAETPLTRVTGLVAATERTAGIAGPGLAALLITALGPPATVLTTAVCFGLSALVMGMCVPAALGGSHTAEAATEPYLRQLRQGWQFVARDRLLLGLAVMIAVTNLLDVAMTSVLLPVWAHDQGRGIAVVGLLLSCMAAAQVVSSALASWRGDRLPRRTTYFVAFALSGPPPFLVLGLDARLEVVIATYLVAGLASGLLNPMLGAMVFERIPHRMLGRVSAPLDALAWAGMPLGGLAAAALVAGIGFTPALLVGAATYLAAVLVPTAAAGSSFDPPGPVAGGTSADASWPAVSGPVPKIASCASPPGT